MDPQFRLLVERAAAGAAQEGALAGVRALVHRNFVALSVALAAVLAGVRLLSGVNPQVARQVIILFKHLRALRALEGALAGGRPVAACLPLDGALSGTQNLQQLLRVVDEQPRRRCLRVAQSARQGARQRQRGRHGVVAGGVNGGGEVGAWKRRGNRNERSDKRAHERAGQRGRQSSDANGHLVLEVAQTVPPESAAIGEGFAAHLAEERPLPSMGAHVGGELPGAGELFRAQLALEWSLARMTPVVDDQVKFFTECLAARVAKMWANSAVDPAVSF